MKRNLTDRAIKAEQPTAHAHDIGDTQVSGLVLRVLPSGVKSFCLVARFPGSRNPTRRSLGVYGTIGIVDARARARQWLDMLSRGIDPATQIAQERSLQERHRRETFAAVAEEFIAQELIGRNPEVPHQRQGQRMAVRVRDILIPLFGQRPIAELTAEEILAAVELVGKIGTDHAMVKLGARKRLRRPNRESGPSPEQARFLTIYTDQILRWAVDRGGYGLTISPLARIKKSKRFGPLVRRRRALDDDETAALWRAAGDLRTPYRQLYRMLTLTGLRLAEVSDASWNEFDLEGKLWTIPAERMKGKNNTARAHVVPLTARMLAVLKEVPPGPRGRFVFSVNLGLSPITLGGRFKVLVDEEMASQLRVHKVTHWTNHDIRRTVRSNLPKLGVDRDTAEMILAHRLGGMADTYDTYERIDERRAALTKWGDHVVSLAERGRKVLRLERAVTN